MQVGLLLLFSLNRVDPNEPQQSILSGPTLFTILFLIFLTETLYGTMDLSKFKEGRGELFKYYPSPYFCKVWLKYTCNTHFKLLGIFNYSTS